MTKYLYSTCENPPLLDSVISNYANFKCEMFEFLKL